MLFPGSDGGAGKPDLGGLVFVGCFLGLFVLIAALIVVAAHWDGVPVVLPRG